MNSIQRLRRSQFINLAYIKMSQTLQCLNITTNIYIMSCPNSNSQGHATHTHKLNLSLGINITLKLTAFM